MPKQNRIIVVGGGLAGLMTTIRAAEAGFQVDLFSLVPVKRSHSVCAQGGINGAVNTKGEGDSPWQHFDDTVYGGDFLANQPPVLGMCQAAPDIIYMFDRMGVPFNRTPEGLIDFRRFGGTQFHRTAFAGATTGQQLMYALDEQVRRWEAEGRVSKYEMWDFLGAVVDDRGIGRGIIAQDLHSMEIRAFRANAVVIATGGLGVIFGKSTNSIINDGAPLSILYQQGLKYANPEFIQVHPTAIPGGDKNRLMSESIRGEGGRVWVYKDGKPWYFLEEKYPHYGNLVPRDIATREIFDVCVNQHLGIDGKNMVYLDVTHIPADVLERKLGGVLEIYEKFVGDDPRKVPMKVFPTVHYNMGGLWVDYGMQASVPGIFGAGEAEYQHHGANRLGANSLLSCIYDGMAVVPTIQKHVEGLDRDAWDLPESLFEAERKRAEEWYERIYRMDGTENPYRIHQELGQIMTDNVTVVRYNDRLRETDAKIQELLERWQRIGTPDAGRWTNQSVQFTAHLYHMLQLARAITLGALNRNESRGAHYKPEFPERDDEHWLKTTIVTFTPDGPKFSYEPVDTSLIPPRPRKYD
ncbi:MAG: succinate dehydrogenase flavoprotein subunit [Bacillota bacterium]|nr:succinate dehydrogenase flavoprotein subunit [Bacillota bacterium]